VDTWTLREGVRGTGRGRRSHSAEFKSEVVQACRAPGVSIAAVSLSYGLNANMVRRWLVELRSDVGLAWAAAGAAHAPRDVQDKFVPLRLADCATSARDIHIELRRGPTTVVVNWSVQEAGACAAWLRELLR
jgi:transposase